MSRSRLKRVSFKSEQKVEIKDGMGELSASESILVGWRVSSRMRSIAS